MKTPDEVIQEAVRTLAKRCPRLVSTCYWAGTSAIAVEELHHRQSFDLDFHTRKALVDVRPILAEMRTAFPRKLAIIQAPDEFGSGFRGVLTLPGRTRITIEVLSNYESVPARDLVRSRTSGKVLRVSLSRYLADKIQCIVERSEARDLVDIGAVLGRYPRMEKVAGRLVAEQDAVLLSERLLAWDDAQIGKDLEAYTDVNPADARRVRDRLLSWLRTGRTRVT